MIFRSHLFQLLALSLVLLIVPVFSFAQNTLGYTSPDTYFRDGMEYFEKANFVASRQAFQHYIDARDPLERVGDYNVVTAQYYIAITSLYLDYPEAEIQIDRFVRNHAEHPKAKQIYADLGQHYYESGEYAKAVGYLEKSMENAGGYASKMKAMYQLAMSYYALQNYGKALPLFNQVKQDNSFENAPDASFYAGILHYQQNKYLEAFEDFSRVENHPYYKTEVPNWLVAAMYQLKKYDELITYGEKVLNQQRGGGKLDDVALYLAEVYYETGDYKKAVEAYQRYLRMKPGTLAPAVSLHYGHALFRTENYKGAIDAMKSIATGRDSVAQYAAYLVGISYLSIDNAPFALTAFENASKLSFNATIKEEASYNKAKVLFELGRTKDAIKEFENYLTDYPSSPYADEVRELIAGAYAASNNNTDAIAYIERLKSRSPALNATYQRLTYNAGVAAYNAEKYAEAISFFDKSARSPMDQEMFNSATFLKAESLMGLKKESEAVSIYNQLLRSGSPNYIAKSNYALGYVFYNQKAYPRALTYFKAFTSNTAGADQSIIEDGYTRLGDCYLAAKNYDEAIRTYEQVAVRGKSGNDYALFQKGRSYVYMNREQEAKRQFELLISQYPNSRFLDDALFQLADLDFQNQAYQQSVRGFTRLINEQPKSYMIPAALLRRGQSYYNLQVYDQATADFKRIIEQYPTSPSATSALEGVQESLNAQGRPEEFSDVLRVVRRNNPSNTKLEGVEFDNATNLYYAEKYTAAISAFQQFIKAYPASGSSYDAVYFIGSSYDKLNKPADALSNYRQVVRDNRSKFIAAAAQRSAEIQISQGNFNLAVQDFMILLRNAETKREEAVARVGLMETYYTLKRYDSTAFYARQLLGMGNVLPGSLGKSQLYLGKVAMDQRRYEEARSEFLKTIASNKDEFGAEANYWLCYVLFTEKKFDESERAIFEMSNTFEGFDDWRAKSFLLLADVYVATNEIPQAKATLNSIIENSENKEVVEQAKAKLARL